MNVDRKRQNPVPMLAAMSPVIEIRDVRLAGGFERKIAMETLFRWVRAGYVQQFATGVYFNLIAAPKSPQTHVYDAVERTLRRPTALIGASALSGAGWTTQMPSGYELAVAVDRNIRTWKSMSGIVAEARSVRWFERLGPHFVKGEGDFDRLPPELALVDAIASRERFSALPRDARMKLLEAGHVTWHPDPDDISLPVDLAPEDAWLSIHAAAELLSVPHEIVSAYCMGISDLEEAVSASSPAAPRQPRC